jgi:hypothetical protein
MNFQDTDGDGLPDNWEVNGIDANGDGVIDLDLPSLGVDPNHKDLFIEVDAMVGRVPNSATVTVPSWATATGTILDEVVVAFNIVPNTNINNPDGVDGIRLHIDLDETNIPLQDFPNGFVEFDIIKGARFGTSAERADPNWANIQAAKALVYRYAIFGNTHSGGGSSGLGELPGNDFMVTLGAWSTPGGTDDQQAGTFMHELGHNLNLGHGGGDHVNRKPNYHSVMSYNWQVPISSYSASWTLDYSRYAFPDLDEGNLDETAGIGGHAGHKVPIYDPYKIVNEQGPVDFNGDGDTLDSGVARDICPFVGPILKSHDDWSVLWYPTGGHPNFADGVHSNIVDDELTFDEFTQQNAISVEVDIDPDTLNLKSKGRWITSYVELPGGYDVNDIDLATVRISDINGNSVDIPAESHPTGIGDNDGDGISDRMVKFDRSDVQDACNPGDVTITVSGELNDGTSFEGYDTIRAIKPGR